MNYEKVAVGLSRSLLEINEAVDACAKECARYDTKSMRRNIANLYAHIFFFLRGTIGWYTRKSARRLLASFKEDFYEQFEDQISNIKSTSTSINREAQQGLGSEMRYTRLSMEDFREGTVIGLQGLHREAALMRFQNERAEEQRAREAEVTQKLAQESLEKLEELRGMMVSSAKAIFLGDASEFFARGQNIERGNRPAKSSFRIKSHANCTPLSNQWQADPERYGFRETSRRRYLDTLSCQVKKSPHRKMLIFRTAMKEDIQLYSCHLEDYFDNTQNIIQHDSSSGLFIEWQVVSALQKWTTAASQILCIVGPSQAKHPSPTSMIAAEYISSAVKLKIPVVSFFCTLPRKRRLSEDLPEVEALISLAYSLIRQLIELLPSVLSIYTKSGPAAIGTA